MAQLVEMPKLGFDMAEGTLAAWVKAENDPIEKGEVEIKGNRRLH